MTGKPAKQVPTLGEDPELWTAYEAAMMLGPPFLTTQQVRHLIHLCSIEPTGKKRSGPRTTGRYPYVYPALQLIRAFDAVYSVTSQVDQS